MLQATKYGSSLSKVHRQKEYFREQCQSLIEVKMLRPETILFIYTIWKVAHPLWLQIT